MIKAMAVNGLVSRAANSKLVRILERLPSNAATELAALVRHAVTADPRHTDLLLIGTAEDVRRLFRGQHAAARALFATLGRTLTIETTSDHPADIHNRRIPGTRMHEEMTSFFQRAVERSGPGSTLVVLSRAFSPYFRSTQKAMMPFQAAGMAVAFGFPYIPTGGAPSGTILADALHVIYSDPSDDKGDYLEFGVYFGRSLLTAAHTYADVFPKMRFFGFDTFEGIAGSLNEEQYFFDETDYYCNLASFRHSVTYSGVDLGRTIAVPGDVTALTGATFQQLGIHKCLCAHIDVDVYRAAKNALDVLTPIIEQGTLLLFDDYYTLKCDNRIGERRAIKEWLQENPRFSLEVYRQYGPTQIAYVVHT